jgi:hypothetical protein
MKRSVRVLALVALLWTTAAAPAAGATVEGIDVVLPKGLSLAGAVRDQEGMPVAGAIAGVCPVPEPCFDRDAVTDASGSFIVNGLLPGTYYAWALPNGPDNLLPAIWGGDAGSVGSFEDAVAIEVTSDVGGIDLVMQPGLRITGHVRSPEGDPVAGIDVIADGGVAIASDASGAFEIVGLEPGWTGLYVSPPSTLPYLAGYVADDTIHPSWGTSFELTNADLTDVEITLLRGRSISGTLQGIGDRRVDVSAIGDRGGYSQPVGPDGSFDAGPLWPGEYRILFTVGEDELDLESQFPYGLYAGDDIELVSQYEPGLTVDATAGDVTGLLPVLPVLPSVSGRVLDDDGGVPNARVRLCSDDLGCAFVLTGADGRFEALNIPPSTYTVYAGTRDRVPSYHVAGGTSTNPELATPVVVGQASVTDIDIYLPAGSTIRGRITGPQGEPITGASVLAIPESGGIEEFGPGWDITGPDGTYVLGGLVDGGYRISVSPALYSQYRSGYWSRSGFTTDYEAASIVQIGTPTIVARSPEPGATGISRRTTVTATFSVPVLGVSRATFELRDGRTNRLLPGTVTYDAETLQAILRPTSTLSRLTEYRVVVKTGIVDAAGVPVEPESWTFRTGS